MGLEEHRQLIEQNRGLVTALAEKYVNRGLSLDALIEAGNVGLANAAEQFDPTRGYKFSTYATWWVRDAITKAIARTTVSKEEEIISANLEEQTRHVLATLTPREEAVLRKRFGIGESGASTPSLDEVGQDFEATRERIREIERKALAKLARRETEEDGRMKLRALVASLDVEKRDRLRKHLKANRDPAKQLAIPTGLASIPRAALKKLILEELDRADEDRL